MPKPHLTSLEKSNETNYLKISEFEIWVILTVYKYQCDKKRHCIFVDFNFN